MAAAANQRDTASIPYATAHSRAVLPVLFVRKGATDEAHAREAFKGGRREARGQGRGGGSGTKPVLQQYNHMY